MTVVWTQWDGRLINGEFQLQKCLGGSDQSGVFLTHYRGEELQQAAIKLVPADLARAELLLSRWRLAEGLSHPHLLKVLHQGRCRLDATDMVFLVMEYAEENIAQILPERPLASSEVEQMLEPALDALAYLHHQGLAHGGIKPANIMAAGDQLKLSSDSLSKAGGSIGDHGKPSVYDPPEKGREGASPAGDIWSLGITLVEVVTQRAPSSHEHGDVDLALPKDFPPALTDIVRGCLHPDPAQRWTIASIRERLHPQVQPAPPATQEPQAQKFVAAAQPSKNRRLPVTLIITLLAVAAILVTVGLSLHDRSSRQSTPEEKVESKPKADQAETPAPKTADKPSPSSVPAATPVPAARRSSGEDEVVEDVLPKISEAARDSIQGTVRVNVRVQVDSSGNVVESEFESPGPSQYFARMAMDAATKWRFTHAGDNGRREFVLHFEFRNSGVKAFVRSLAR